MRKCIDDFVSSSGNETTNVFIILIQVKMLIPSSLPNSTEAALSFASDHGKPDLLCDWLPDAETWQKFPKCDGHHQDVCKIPVSTKEKKENADDFYSLIQPRTCSKLLTISTMCASSAPSLVYKRRNLQNKSVAIFTTPSGTKAKPTGACLSSVSSEGPSPTAEKDHVGSQIKPEIGSVKASVIPADLCNGELVAGDASTCNQLYPENHDGVPSKKINYNCGFDVNSEAEFVIQCSVGEELGFDEAPGNNVCKCKCDLEYYSVNDSCSSSKSNTDLGSASPKIEVDDIGECSSSDSLAREVLAEDQLEKEICISILRSHGLLEGIVPVGPCAAVEVLGVSNDGNCSQQCKACGISENPQKMLICDHCEEAFHVSCLNPKIKKLPVDDWFCQPCLKRMRKIESAARKSSECQNRASKGESGPISLMLRDVAPYRPGVRVGKGYQADVPDWTGSVSNDVDCFGEPQEMDPAECFSSHVYNSNKSTPSSIGNWLQCRDALCNDAGESIEGTICGKWRRAPLFEVQTDDWNCSCAVLWDPIHSDCAVPQELDTDQVIMHLKYIEMLRPRLAAKKRKLSHTSSEEDKKA
ncbi:hypothetical protein NE237_022641 [Protea cynaroides]|uniref:Uncharacterized protein n=1 Tax=Protea cynaroides TaxID=273540 RepID=A0A9Q0K4N5_9MAGN|nr:hypothetical protein NE237_022641 [Protea cynaroides]